MRNQCLEKARGKCSPRRGEEVDTRDALRACVRDLDLISPTSQGQDGDDTITIEGDNSNYIFVRNQCLKVAEAVLAPPAERTLILGTR